MATKCSAASVSSLRGVRLSSTRSRSPTTTVSSRSLWVIVLSNPASSGNACWICYPSKFKVPTRLPCWIPTFSIFAAFREIEEIYFASAPLYVPPRRDVEMYCGDTTRGNIVREHFRQKTVGKICQARIMCEYHCDVSCVVEILNDAEECFLTGMVKPRICFDLVVIVTCRFGNDLTG